MTMLTFKSNNPEQCGIVETDEKGVLVGFYEKVKSPPSDIANGAIYILSKEFMINLKDNLNSAKDFSLDIIPWNYNKIYTYYTNDTLI